MTWRFYSWTLDREFNFTQWCEYLKEHHDETAETALEYHGFLFNVHGHCMTPNVLRVEDSRKGKGTRNYYEIRTYMTPSPPIRPGWRERGNDIPCWSFSNFAIGNAAGGFKGGFSSERDAIDAAIIAAEKYLLSRIGWYDAMIYAHKDDGIECGYSEAKKQNLIILQKTRNIIQDRKQLTLF